MPVKRRFQLEAFLAHHPRNVASLVDNDVLVKAYVAEYLAPEASDVAVDNDDLDQARIHHFEEVLVLELLGSHVENDLGPAFPREFAVQLKEVLVVAARLADKDLLVGKILHAGDRGRSAAR